MLSLHGRINLAALTVLMAFLGLTGLALDEAFRQSAEAAMRDRLQGQVYALLGAADEDASGGLMLPEAPPDPRFSRPDSGLYARVWGADGKLDWRSPSLLGRPGAFMGSAKPGQWRFSTIQTPEGALMAVNFGVMWEDDQGVGHRYVFAVAESMAPLLRQIARFRTTLWLWLGGSTLVLLAVQGLVLRWGLSPLRRVAAALQRIESGDEERLEGAYPKELRGLTQNLNALIARSRANQERYRNSLADLAHSLKTPLAILRGAAELGGGPTQLETVGEQVQRMDEIVRHQLQRASASGQTALARAISVAAVVDKLIRAMVKVYRDKAVECRADVLPEVRFVGDEGDLMEILGNVLDNAFKYCEKRVELHASIAEGGSGLPGALEVRIEDDGPGIPQDQVSVVLQRGRRADQRHPGHGIGLSVADEIVRLYRGTVAIGRSDLGGAEIRVRLPG
jgi:two-component system sensor histidine kinase PhoQ